MVTSVFSKPKLHKILPPLVWDNETVKQTLGKLASTLVRYMLKDTQTQSELSQRGFELCCCNKQPTQVYCTLCIPCFLLLCPTRRHEQYCVTAWEKHTHIHTHQFHVKRLLGPGKKLIPSTLRWSQQNDLKTTSLIILSHQIKRTLSLKKKKEKKGFSHFTQKGFQKLLPLHNKFRTITTDCTPQKLKHFTTLVS